MKRAATILFHLLILWSSLSYAQVAVDCSNAIPICNNTPTNGGTQGYGIDDFNGAFSSGCLEQTLSGAIESNSAWYRFRTGAAGQLGFNIGFDTNEDWDFALYQAADCNNLGDPVRCNFFDNQDQEAYMGVGEDPTGSSSTVLYEDWLQVEAGQDYYLLINNFSNTNSGFSIQFTGDIFVTNPMDALDCSIISNLLGPPLAACDNQIVVLDATTVNAHTYGWYMDTGTGFQLISGETAPTLNATISAMYRVQVVLTDMSQIISDVQVAFSVAPVTMALSHEILCSDLLIYDLSQKNVEALGSQDPDEVIVSYHASQSDADSGTNSLPIQYSLVPGIETIYVRTTSSSNPDCFDASRNFQLEVVETPAINFPTELFICEDTSGEVIGEIVSNPLYSYSWDTGENTSSITVTEAGIYTLTIINNQSGQTCVNTASINVVVSETPVIGDVIIEDLQNNNTVEIIPGVEGSFEYQLDTGSYQSSNLFTDVAPGLHTVTINDLNGCGSVSATITVVGFPKFFTPNGDGSNDFWNIMGISTLDQPIVQVFDRFGKFIKQIDENSAGWDGTFNGRDMPSTDYWFLLTYVDTDGQRVEAKYVNNHFALRR